MKELMYRNMTKEQLEKEYERVTYEKSVQCFEDECSFCEKLCQFNDILDLILRIIKEK